MKIERINENSFRCTLTSLDLSSRNINLRDMTYGSEAAKRLFTEMMQKAQTEFGFHAEDGPLMIEAVPLQGGSIQLVISRVDDPEELDTRFSRFTQNATPQNGWLSQLATEILEGAQDLIKQLKEKKADDEEALNTDSAENGEENGRKDVLRVFAFRSLERVIAAAKAAGNAYSGENTLFKDPETKIFYLVLHSGEDGVESLSRVLNHLSEFGQKLKNNELLSAYYEEHYDVILRGRALQQLAKI